MRWLRAGTKNVSQLGTGVGAEAGCECGWRWRVCGVCRGEDEGVAEALGMQSPSHDEAALSLRWCYTQGEARR